MAAIQTAVQTQYLSSNLSDSTVPRTGFPEKLEEQVNHVVKGPILVEITAMDDIGVSAFTLNKTRLVREERMAAGELEQGDGDEEIEGEGPIPKYPRSTLSLRISDGTYALKALEYKPLPELVLGSTPLGCKASHFFPQEYRHTNVAVAFVKERHIYEGDSPSLSRMSYN